MELQDTLISLNILTTLVVGYFLRSQIKSQKEIIANYKDFVSAINPSTALQLKDAEIEQIKKNMSNDIQTLQKQVAELSFYVNHIIEYGETTSNETDSVFDRDAFITNTLPSCRTILDSYKRL